jgi:hypothetical protein
MQPNPLHQFGSLVVRSTLLVSTLIAVISLPSIAAPDPFPMGYFTPTREDVPYSDGPRQLVVSQNSNQAIRPFSKTVPVIIGATSSNGLPLLLEIRYPAGTQATGGGGQPPIQLPRLGFVPIYAENMGGELNAPVRSQAIQTRAVTSNPGYFDQTNKHVVTFSF